MEELKLDIADILISLTADEDGWKLLTNGSHQRFCGFNRKPEVVLKAHYGSLPDLNLGKQIFHSGGNWSLFRNKKHYVFSLCSPATGPLPYALAILEPNFKSGDIYLRTLRIPGLPPAMRNLAINPLEYPLDEILMINLLAKGRGLIIHACGIKYKEMGFLFVGTSGAGKSTIANLWKKKKEAVILSDDRIIIRKLDSKFYIFGTPWHGDARVCSPERAPLEKIYFIKHARENGTKKLNRIKTTSRLIICSFPTFWDKKGMKFTLNLCAELAQKIPCDELCFVPDETILNFIRNEI